LDENIYIVILLYVIVKKGKMVHKKYIKVKGKTYGPYYYESYREGGKVKKRYVKVPDSRVNAKRKIVKKKTVKRPYKLLGILFVSVLLVLVLVLVASFFIPSDTFREFFLPGEILLAPTEPAFGSDGNVNLTIWDETEYVIRRSGDSVEFYANFTDVSGVVIDDTGGATCQIRYENSDGSFTSFSGMSFDIVYQRWEASSVFDYVGVGDFEVDCNDVLGGVILLSGFEITNTPVFFHTSGINMNGLEDLILSYNFSANVTDIDVNDVLSFVIEEIDGPLGGGAVVGDYTWFSMDSDTGVMTIEASSDSETGSFTISVFVSDLLGEGESRQFTFNIAPVNDAPVFEGLENKTFNSTQKFDFVINVSDEEGDVPFVYDISFLSCDTAPWSSRGSVNCDLFDNTMYIADDTKINISFTPSKDDVGDYVINFSVWDSNVIVQPLNALRSVVVNFTVQNINSVPYFTYVCDNERTAVEDTTFGCSIIMSDDDELNNLTSSSDPIWFVDDSVIVNFGTGFSGTSPVSFTPTDENVGNWIINISMIDTGIPVRHNSTVIDFFVSNIDDAVSLDGINNINVYTSEIDKKIYVNASDEDLLIPDKNLYNEVLIFSSDNPCVSVVSDGVIFGTDITRALIQFNPNDGGCFIAGQNYDISISVVDSNAFSMDSTMFNINVIGNNVLQWNNPEIEQVLIEDVLYYINLTEYVSDPDEDPITFSSDHFDFASFAVAADTGVIDFTPIDGDVGEHLFYINATDIVTIVPFLFNYTVRNVNDNPNITDPPFQGSNFSLIGINIFVQEDNDTEIFMFVGDDDLRVLGSQSGFYQETFNVDLNIEGPNNDLFSFLDFSYFDPNLIRYRAYFRPGKSDVGDYNITINVTDSGNVSSVIWFNLTVGEVQHFPVLDDLADQGTIANRTLYYDINASDVEDGNDAMGNMAFSYEFLSDGNINDFINGDENVFNSTYGILNYTFSDADVGAYHLNVSVTDSFGLKDSEDFWIFVYDLPVILSPGFGFVFNLVEGDQSNFTFVANSSGIGNLSYNFFISGNLRDSLNYYGDGTALVWNAIPAYTDETYGLYGNLSLVVAIPGFEYLNASMVWDANISNANAPVVFFNSIADKQSPHSNSIEINLRGHFFDADDYDTNQSFNFEVVSNATGNGTVSLIGANVNDWTLSLSASSKVAEKLNVTVSDLHSNGTVLTSATSNEFEVIFTDPTIVPQPTSGGGGGGGGGGGSSRKKPIALRIIVPDPVSTRKGETLVLPLRIVNEGPISLEGIDLMALLAKDGILSEDFEISLSKGIISSLPIGASENLTLTVILTDEVGIYEININAEVSKPDYSESAKIFIKVEEGETLGERLLFAEELVVENPECAEIKELVDESRDYLNRGDFTNAEIKIVEAVNACKASISKQSIFSKTRLNFKFQDKMFIYLLLATIIAVVFGIGYYVYQRVMLKRALQEAEKLETDDSKKVLIR
jgi:hypothetical protein